MPLYSLRPATSADAALILEQLVSDSLAGHYLFGAVEEAHTKFSDHLTSVIVRQKRHDTEMGAMAYSFCEDNRPAGFVVMSRLPFTFRQVGRPIEEIWLLGIFHSFRNRGLGPILVQQIVATAGEKTPLVTRCLPASRRAREIFLANGFAHIATGKYGEQWLFHGSHKATQAMHAHSYVLTGKTD